MSAFKNTKGILAGLVVGMIGGSIAVYIFDNLLAPKTAKVTDESKTFILPSITQTPSLSEENFNWNEVESTNYFTFVANLRQIGCPEETVDDIVVGEISRLYAPKIAAAQKDSIPRFEYWKAPQSWSRRYGIEPARLYREKSDIIMALLGIDIDDYARKCLPVVDGSDGPLAFLSSAKQRPLNSLQAKYRALEDQIREKSHGLTTDEDRAALAAIESQKTAEMDSLLTPEEKIEYGLRSSPMATKLARDLETFQPSEAEFRAIYQAQIALDAKSQGSSDTNSSWPNVDPTTAYTLELKSALGEQRFDEYQRSKDPGYQTLVKIADRFNLTPDAAAKIFELKQEAEAQAQKLRAETDLDSDQKQASLRALRDQTIANVMTALGDNGYSTYRDYGGTWMDRLAN